MVYHGRLSAMQYVDLISLVGGLAIFLYGMGLARDSLQLVAGARLRSIIATLTEHRLLGLVSGVALAVLLQSSNAATVMLVNFVSTGLMSLGQAMAVTLGAAVGSTVTVQVISFRVAAYGLVFVALGYLMMFTAKRRQLRYIGELVLSFGFIFFGMKLMGDSTSPLKDAGMFQEVLGYFARHPWAGFVAAAAFTGIVQASAATIGLVISLALGGSMTLDVALPMVLGANVGTSVTAILAGIGSPPEGKRVAIAQLIWKVTTAAGAMFLLGPLADAARFTADDVVRQIANAHTLFNLAAAVVAVPFVNLAAAALERFYQPERGQEIFGPKYLDTRALETPSLAFGQAMREFLRMADIVNDMFRDCYRVFEASDLDLLADIESRDDQVDILNREIKLYLARLTQRDLTSEQADHELELVTLSNYVENAGDTVTKNILPLAKKMISRGLLFSEDGWKEICDLHTKVSENFQLALAAFSTRDEGLARKVLRHATNFEHIEAELRQAHLERLHQAVPETFETSAIHMDLITYLVRVNQHVSQLAEAVLRDLTRRDAIASTA